MIDDASLEELEVLKGQTDGAIDEGSPEPEPLANLVGAMLADMRKLADVESALETLAAQHEQIAARVAETYRLMGAIVGAIHGGDGE